jgi:hypothetical protein
MDPQSVKIRIFLGIKQLHDAWVAEAASFPGNWATARVYPLVFKFFSVKVFSHIFNYF